MLLCSLTYVWNYDFREWKASVGWFKPVRKFRLSKTKDMYQPAEGKPKVKVWGGKYCTYMYEWESANVGKQVD